MTTTSQPFQINIKFVCANNVFSVSQPKFIHIPAHGLCWRALSKKKMLHNHLRLSGDCMQQTSKLINDGKHMYASDMCIASGPAEPAWPLETRCFLRKSVCSLLQQSRSVDPVQQLWNTTHP